MGEVPPTYQLSTRSSGTNSPGSLRRQCARRWRCWSTGRRSRMRLPSTSAQCRASPGSCAEQRAGLVVLAGADAPADGDAELALVVERDADGDQVLLDA